MHIVLQLNMQFATKSVTYEITRSASLSRVIS
jgi:hypothetical protein